MYWSHGNFSKHLLLGVWPRHWQLLTTSQVISLGAGGWEIFTKHRQSGKFSSLLHHPASESTGGMSSREVFRRSFTAEACLQPHPEPGAGASNSQLPPGLLAAPRLPYWLPYPSYHLLSIQKPGEAKVKSFYVFMWQQAWSPMLKKCPWPLTNPLWRCLRLFLNRP